MLKNRIARLTTLAVALAFVAWAAIALAGNPLQGGSGATGITIATDGSPGGNAYTQGSLVNGVETVNSSSAVTVSTIAAYPGSVITGETRVACMSMTACTGGSSGDWFTESVQWTVIYAPGSGGAVLESGPTTIGVVSHGSSMSSVSPTVVPSGANVLIQVSTEASCTVDCNVWTTWLQVN